MPASGQDKNPPVGQQDVQTSQTPTTAGGLYRNAKYRVGKLDFEEYRKKFEDKYKSLYDSDLLYDKMVTFQKCFNNPTITDSRRLQTVDRLKELQRLITNSKQLFVDHFAQVYGVGPEYVEEVFIPRLSRDIDYLLDNYKRFSSKKLNTEAYLLNFDITLRNIPLGQVLVSSNDNMELTLRNVIAALAAGNSVLLHLGPVLKADSNILKVFAEFEAALPDSFKVIEKVEGRIDSLGLVNAIGIENMTELKSFAASHRALLTVQNSGTNICVVAPSYSPNALHEMASEIVNNKLDLAGRSDKAISHWFISRRHSQILLSKLEILIEREFEHPETARRYFGKTTFEQVVDMYGSSIDSAEFFTHPENTEEGVFKPAVVLNPQNKSLLKSVRSPLIIIYEYDSDEELLIRVNEIDKADKINNVHYFTDWTDFRNAENMALKMPGSAFHVNSLNPYIRSAGGNSNSLVTETRLLGGYNYIGLFSRRQLVVKRLFSGIECLNLYPLTNKKYDFLRMVTATSWLTRRRLKNGLIVGGLSYLLWKDKTAHVSAANKTHKAGH